MAHGIQPAFAPFRRDGAHDDQPQALHPLRLENMPGLQGRDVDGHSPHGRRAATEPDRNRPVVRETRTAVSVRDLNLLGQIRGYLPVTASRAIILDGDKPLAYQQVRRMCERIQRDPGFGEKIMPIRFRTTVLTDLYDQANDLKQIQRRHHGGIRRPLMNHLKIRGSRKPLKCSKKPPLFKRRFAVEGRKPMIQSTACVSQLLLTA